MRKLIGALLAATMLMPTIATAQEPDRRGDRPRGDMRGDMRGDGRGDRQRAPDAAPDVGQARQAPWRDDTRRGGFQGERRDPAAERPDRNDGPRGGIDRGDRPEPRRPDFQPADRGRPGSSATWRDGNRTERGIDDRQGDRRDDRRNDGRDWNNRGDRNDRRGDDWTRSRFNDRDRVGNWSNDRRFNGSDRGNDWSNDRRGNNWDRGWRNENRYDWNRYRTTNRGAYRLPRYYAPNGWDRGYRRFGVGAGLSSVLWNRNYWISDPWSYRLPEAYGPYRWVRYYDDALLVDLRSGQVIDAVYGIFW
ncbi:RcnB family protein [Sphingomonas mollis]|uniref:RcnB family protein n=1 Tax=Sphingomonas mollis TaxID=2795726 RepID=A0ABS0XPK6_9SPHN|nr:RcnB family protein [Sphingomonas sp. BT553]MBJ6121937.1 RcnB family protein [Sphingomonas sp. BT553]